MPQDRDILVIADGGLPFMVACLLERRPVPLVLWVPPFGARAVDGSGTVIGPEHHAAVEAIASFLGGGRVVKASSGQWGENGSAGPASLWDDARLLIEACRDAEALGCGEVIWPAALGDDADALVAGDELCRCINRLASWACTDGPVEREALRAPLIDLTRDQVADLALDLDAPIDLCWWHAQQRHGEVSGQAWNAEALWTPIIAAAADSLGLPTPSLVRRR